MTHFIVKVTSPLGMSSGISKVEELVNKFEKEFSKEKKDQYYYHLVVVGEYNRAACDEVEKIYSKAGWLNVKCITSSENGEKPGLTGLTLNKKSLYGK